MTMQVNITGDNLSLTNPIEQHVIEKLHKIENKFKHITNVHVILSIENQLEHKAEATMNLSGGKSGKIFANSASKNMYNSINSLMKKLEAQVLEHKNRMKAHNKDSHL